MTTLDSEVKSVVQNFMQNNELFTALDVSNKVKMALPFARHREVRDLVRSLFTTDIEPASWARSPINVTLADGSQAEALLYHPLSDSWDLDNKYDSQKRAQAAVDTSKAPTSLAAKAANVAVTAIPGLPVPTTANPMPKVVAAPVLPAKDLWANLFNSKPSLFPMK
jgi:hypothetical protein